MTKKVLPLLDLSDFHAGGRRREDFLHKLKQAVRDIGFFYLTGHGISEQQNQHVLDIARQFFALPQDSKRKVQMIHSPHFRGYTHAGGELTLGQADWREQFDVMREAPVIPLYYGERPWLRLQGPNQWPREIPEMKAAILDWQEKLTAVTLSLLRIFALILEQEEHVFDHTVNKGPFQHLKLIRYPGRDLTASDQGVGAHKDAGYLTLVLQDKEAGLEALIEDEWVRADPVPGSFVVNIGELLELASNGYLKATLHRVTTPAAGRDRLSCAFFMAAQLDSDVPLLNLPPHLRQEAKGPSSDPKNPLFYEVGRNVLKGRLRSHPDVSDAHYGELESVVLSG